MEIIAKQHTKVIKLLQEYFSSNSGSYYSQALFFISTVFHKILTDVDKIILLDADLQFRSDVKDLYSHFNSFKSHHVIGISPELSPVYRHILYTYRQQNPKTVLGNPKPEGFPGFNSGVLLLNLGNMRNSTEYHLYFEKEILDKLTREYTFKGHLGDQDFYTLVGLENPALFYDLPCGWNRQLCTWWRDHGYKDVFEQYFYCHGKIHIYHGNCNTPIPDS